MVPSQRIRRIGPVLTEAQERVLLELAEPNDNPKNEWRLGGRMLRPARALVDHGFAEEQYYGGRGYVFFLTEAGRARVDEIRRRESERDCSDAEVDMAIEANGGDP